ncbi:hypothetical protein [Sporobacter termitidis]|uniref:hypothetical protein n=1 Tax=Sporobacter termitidis TaxID=44749 RepID=UPI001160530B|nr:hypothetical protein [Sporobacter termitidis]
MASIVSSMYFENFQNQIGAPQPTQQFSNPIMALLPLSIPGNFSFVFTFGMNYDVSQSHNLQVIFKDPQNNILNNTGEICMPASDDQYLPAEYRGIIFTMDYRNIPIRSTGVFAAEVYFDGALLGTCPIPAYPAKPLEGDVSIAR